MHATSRFRSARAAAVACALAVPAFCPALAVPTQVFELELQSSAAYSSALTTSGPSRDAYIAQSAADWAADGRNRQVDVFVVPAVSIVPSLGLDLARAWLRFEEAPNGNGSVHAFARSSGYYFEDSAGNFARSEITLRQTVRVENLGARAAEVRMAQATHGFLLSGGNANAATASAHEQVTMNGWCTNCFDTGSSGIARIAMGWLGEATVFGDGLTAGFNVGGAWAGQHRNAEAQLPGFDGPIAGIELQALVASDPLLLAPDGVAELEITYHAWFQVDMLGVESGFLSFGQADFANTGTMNWLAIDPATGAPAEGVRFSIVGDVDTPATGLPVPGTAALLLLAGPLLARAPGRRRRPRSAPGPACTTASGAGHARSPRERRAGAPWLRAAAARRHNPRPPSL